ncbi:uncharacterized protein ASPGLDRAFT_37364 [Aspergillus glaucus CBS 516.65]|uniref:Ankyrin repeat-containing protein n=1 Tax=Aspergillus glaucus CBS 516.65 TaxID=1160497 RepID=A0A1L9VDR7_ASPGL|nr:hypothetical protein ASPGLDRAFT_37364 [Aspergillus glaucus CBS 516.65]OJJ82049.1 hypothetical protein ASPGLDRAFT_37364 [Aspergillus glaucus CBS 516.65]
MAMPSGYIGNAPLLCAIPSGNLQAMLGHHAYLDCPGCQPEFDELVLTAAIPFESTFRLLLNNVNPRETTDVLLTEVLESGNIIIVQLLRDAGIQLKSPDIRSGPFILASTVKGDKAMVDFVFDHGFFFETSDEEERYQEAVRAIFAALDNEDAEVLKLLINNDMLVTDDFFYQNADALLEKSISVRNIEQATA